VLDRAGVEVTHLPTYYGPIDYTLASTPACAGGAPREVVATIGGEVSIPPGGIVLKSPLSRSITSVSGDGRLVAPGGDEIKIEKLPASVRIAY
jgi:hypothetical protein